MLARMAREPWRLVSERLGLLGRIAAGVLVRIL